MPNVNGHPAECGSYVEGHWGQYGADHLAEQAEAFGWSPDKPTDDPREIRKEAEAAEEEGRSHWHWEVYMEAADDIEEWLNDRTGFGYIWHWHDGEFFLSPLCENGDCDDDTCAHWD